MLVYNSASGESVRSWQAATQEYFCVPFWNLKHCINPRTKSCIIYRYTFAAKHWQDLDAVGIESIGVYQYWCISEQSINTLNYRLVNFCIFLQMGYSKAKDWQVLAAAVSVQEYILLQSYVLQLLENIGVYIREKHKQSGRSLSYSNLFWS